MSPTQVVIGVLGLLLAISCAGNAWQYREHDAAVEAKATAQQLNHDTAAAASACSSSVDRLADDTKARGKRLEGLLKGASGQIQQLEAAATDALAARPVDPTDLCKSALVYLQAQIRKERAGAQP